MNPQEETQHQLQSGPTCVRRQVVVSSYLGHQAGRGWIILDSLFFYFFQNDLSVLTSVLRAVFNTRQMERHKIPFCLVAWCVIKPAANLKCVLSESLPYLWRLLRCLSKIPRLHFGRIWAVTYWLPLCCHTGLFTVQSSGSKSSEELGFHSDSQHISVCLFTDES